MHSEDVGRQIYDKSNARTRAEFINSISSKETPQKKREKRGDKKRRIEMNQMEEEDAKNRKKNAAEFLQKLRIENSQNRRKSSRCNLSPPDRRFLQKLVFEEVFQSKLQEFPKGKSF